MSTLSQFMPGGKPKRIQTYTSGSGTYTPIAPNSWCYVRLVGGGGAGGTYYCCYSTSQAGPGYHGYVLEQWTQVVSTAAYSVGAAGTYVLAGHHPHYYYAAQAAGATTFNGLSATAGATGGSYPTNTGAPGVEGTLRLMWQFGVGYNNGGMANGRGGGFGGSCGNTNSCPGGNQIGATGNNGYILIQDFGP